MTLLTVFPPALVVLTSWLMPALVPRTLPFGVRIPPEHADDDVIVRQRRQYRWWVAVAGGVLLVVTAVLALVNPLFAIGWPAPLAAVGVLLPGYLRARQAIRSAKEREGWFDNRRQGVAADTTLRTGPDRFPWLWATPALVLLGITVAVGIVRYPTMPATLVEHYNLHNVPDRVAPKSIGSAFGLVFVQAGVTALILVMTVLSFRARPALDAAAPATTARQHRVFRSRMARTLLVLAACVNLSMLLVAWRIWNGAGRASIGVAMLPLFAGLVVLLIVAVRTGQGGSRLPADGDEDTGMVQRDDDRYWRAGMFYANRHDPALLVPKRFGVGWTVNFGNPHAVLFLLIPLVLIVVVPLLVR